MRSREVLMCSERYADDIPFLLPTTQLPPRRSDFSKQPTGRPRSCSPLAAAMPDEPAPMTQTVGSSDMGRSPCLVSCAGVALRLGAAGGCAAPGADTVAKMTGASSFARGPRQPLCCELNEPVECLRVAERVATGRLLGRGPEQ